MNTGNKEIYHDDFPSKKDDWDSNLWRCRSLGIHIMLSVVREIVLLG